MLRLVVVLSFFTSLLIAQTPTFERIAQKDLDSAIAGMRPIAECDKNAKDEFQIYCHQKKIDHFLIQILRNSKGRITVKGWRYATFFVHDVNITYDYHCEATKKWLPSSTDSTILCVGAGVKGTSLAKDRDFMFSVGPCFDRTVNDAFCRMRGYWPNRTHAEMTEEWLNSNINLVLKMYGTKKIDFSRFSPPTSSETFDDCEILGNPDLLDG
jgi:hypothetical protein